MANDKAVYLSAPRKDGEKSAPAEVSNLRGFHWKADKNPLYLSLAQ